MIGSNVKQLLLARPILNATKQVIKERLKGEQDLEEYLRFYKDYFSFRSIDIICPSYKNVNQALNRICNINIYIGTEVYKNLEKVRGGRGCWAYYVLPKPIILKLIDEVKKELEA
ncbi:hypothetical protein [Aliarcobacter lanthieri]|uniref:hypothetical protein n=1 Tax=Aliarcobacter lanthieri TaxID=1355374 RepID=UPI003AAB197C